MKKGERGVRGENCPVLCRWHSSGLNVFLHIVAFIILVWALWIHNLEGILVAVVIAAFGHFIQFTKIRRRK